MYRYVALPTASPDGHHRSRRKRDPERLQSCATERACRLWWGRDLSSDVATQFVDGDSPQWSERKLPSTRDRSLTRIYQDSVGQGVCSYRQARETNAINCFLQQ